LDPKEQIKSTFSHHQKEYFNWEIRNPSDGYLQTEWEQACQEYLKPILIDKSFDVYLDNILNVAYEMIDKGIAPIVLAEVIGQWRFKITAGIREIIRRRHYEEYKSKTPKRIFEKHRKSIKPELIEYIKAYTTLQKLSTQSEYSMGEQVGLAGYLENNDYTHVQPPLNDLGKVLKELISNQSQIIIGVKTANDLEDDLKGFYSQFLETQIEVRNQNGGTKKFFFEFRDQSYGLESILQDIEWAITNYAEKRFGYEGRLIAQTLLEGKKLEEVDNQFIKPAPLPKHHPEDVNLNRIILNLYEHSVDEILIARLVNALENREHYKIQSDSKNAEWQVRKQTMVSNPENSVRKAISQRIKTLGGNSLRYNINLLIKERKECRKCDWRYDERGILVRIPCKSHKKAKKELGVRLVSPGWRESLEKKGFSFYANALTFVSVETKSGKTARKKIDLVSDK
jgi:hypothetical protein